MHIFEEAIHVCPLYKKGRRAGCQLVSLCEGQYISCSTSTEKLICITMLKLGLVPF